MFMSDTDFVEPIARFRVMYQEQMLPEHEANYRLRGLDPKDQWSLEWSFDNEADANEQLAESIERAARWGIRTYRMVDARPAFFNVGAADALTGTNRADEYKRANEREWYLDGYRCNGGIVS